MQVDYIIVGQGLCGTHLSYQLHKAGKSFVVIDDQYRSSSSMVAAGLMNPVTGRRYTTTWKAEEILPFARQVYEEMGRMMDTRFIFNWHIIDFFPNPQMREAFLNKITEDDTYVRTYPEQNQFNPFVHYDFGCGEIHPAYTVHLSLLLANWRQLLMERHALIEECFNAEDLKLLEGGVQYGDITAEKIFFCDGSAGVNNPWFQLLPYALNKGEVLIIESEDLPAQHIYKKGMMLIPLPVNHTFWLGSNFSWHQLDDQPSEQFYRQATTLLSNFLKVPYKILFHKAALRPATVERRPFAGLHPLYPQLGILNGMGTKGTSLAPYFAHELVQHLVHGFPLTEAADVKRFSRILSR